MNNENFELIKGITVTMLFEASALNRDEKAGGNVLTIKKLTRLGNQTFSYISRPAIRHYLFSTLSCTYPDDWKPAPVKSSEDVIQFDITSSNILDSAELDTFGYMYTIGEQASITRKGVVGITKAVSLEPWEGDMQFNANHDLVRRCDGKPSPVNREEHMSLYKVSFTLDVKKLGYDEWWINDYSYDKRELKLELGENDKSVISNVDKINEYTYEVCGRGEIRVFNPTPSDRARKKAIFILDEDIKKRRICQILNVLKNGLKYHASGESYGIIPKFLVVAGLSLPIPLFHTYIDLKSFKLSQVFYNSYILSGNSKKKVFISNHLDICVDIESDKYYTNWREFLCALGLREACENLEKWQDENSQT